MGASGSGSALLPARSGSSTPSRRTAIGRLIAAHRRAVAALVLAGFVLVYLWPVLVGGEILSPLALLYAFAPWRHQFPPEASEFYNSQLIDVPAALYPYRWLVRELLHEGVFPAWNPHAFAGTPLYANPQSGLFSLFSLPLWILPLNYGLGVAAALKLWAGGFGTYLLVRELRLSLAAGILAGVCFAFSAFNIVWLTHETLPAVAAMLPWAVWLVERIARGGGLGCVLALAAVVAIGHGGGHPGTQVQLLAIATLYAALRALLGDDAPRRARLRALAASCGGLALGTLLMSVALIPEVRASHGTIGALVRAHGGTLPGAEMPLETIRTVLFPDWWGRPSAFQVDAALNELVPYNERTFYAGAVALLLAGVALLSRGAWRRKAPFAVLGVVGLAVPLHAPGLYQLATRLPILDRVQSQRLHFAFAFGVAVLAAFGLQSVLDRPRGERRRLLAPLAALVLAGVAFMAAGAQPGDAGRTLRHFVTGADFQLSGVMALTSVAWFGLFALAVLLALLVARRWPGSRRLVAAALVLLAMADAYHFAHGYQPMGPADKLVPPATPAVAYLQQHAGEGRILGLGPTLLNDYSLTYGLDDVRGYDPPQPALRLYRLWRIANPAQVPWRPFWIEGLDARTLRIASVLGARWLVLPPDANGVSIRDRVLRPLSRVYVGDDAGVLLNPNAAPRAMLPAAVELAAGERATRDALAAPGFDPLRTVVVERDQPGTAALAGAQPRGEVAIVRERNARVELRATLDRPGLVVLNDNWAEGWTVRVDGRAAVPLRVNDVMRGVVVGAGRHEIAWSYAVPGLRLGVAMSLVGLALLLAGLVVVLVRRRRASDLVEE